MTGPLTGKSRIGVDIGGVPKLSKISLIYLPGKRQRHQPSINRSISEQQGLRMGDFASAPLARSYLVVVAQFMPRAVGQRGHSGN